MKRLHPKKVIEPNLDIVPGSALKRAGAVIIDLIIMYIVMNIFYFGVHPVINEIYDYDAKLAESTREMKRSHLVELTAPLSDDESNIDDINIVTNTAGLASLKQTEYASGTYKFYTLYMNENDPVEENLGTYTNEWFVLNILKIEDENSLFEIDLSLPEKMRSATSNSEQIPVIYDLFLAEGVTYKEEATIAEINDFHKGIYNDATTIFNKRPLYNELTEISNIETIILLVLASSITFLALPLFMKNGQTLGKKLFKLGIATTYGYKISVFNLLIRYFAFLLINGLSNYIIPVVFPFISLTIMVFNKKGKAGHDFIAGSMVVDLTRSTIYNNEDEFRRSQLIVGRVKEGTNEELFSERFNEESGA